ncbi:MAG: glycosyltransferase family 39 protein [Candidatus Krumholzibacteriota bacterium]|nr:glycosyltransferase family 39 protein [Candidatus Krumholzibacteriota bacterium]
MRRGSIVAVIMILALAARLLLVPSGLRQAESRGMGYYDEYGGIAKNISEGRGFSYDWYGELRPTSIHSPVYPYLLAAIFSLAGTGKGAVFAIIMVNIILSMVLIYFLFRASEALFGPLAGIATLILVAFYPGQIYYSVSGLPTILYTLILFSVITAAWRLKERLSTVNALVWGAAIGFCALSYSFVMALAPVLAIWLFITSGRRRFGRSAAVISISALTALIILAPWTVRNYQVHKRWIPVRDQSGTNLWWGNGPQATGGVNGLMANSDNLFTGEITEKLHSFANEVDGDRYMRKLAVDFMKENPGRTARLWMHKILIFWWFDTGPVAAGSGIGRFLPVLKLLKGLLLLLSAGGFFILVKRRPDLASLGLAVCAVMTMVFMIFFSGRLRYFTPLEPVLFMSGGYLVYNLLSRFEFARTLAEKI